MTVDTANLDRLVVDMQLSAGNANITETHLQTDALNDFPIESFQL